MEAPDKYAEFRRELRSLINKYSLENGANTPDFILAEYLYDCLHTFEVATRARTKWYSTKVTDWPENPSPSR